MFVLTMSGTTHEGYNRFRVVLVLGIIAQGGAKIPRNKNKNRRNVLKVDRCPSVHEGLNLRYLKGDGINKPVFQIMWMWD
jgi:hypothetical protein